MLVKYNSENNSFIINDEINNFKKIYLLLRIINTIALSLMTFNHYKKDGFNGITPFFFFLAIIAIGILIVSVYKKTYSKEIKLQDIAYLKEHTLLGRKRFSIRLKSNKNRDIHTTFKNYEEIENFKKVFQENGITIK